MRGDSRRDFYAKTLALCGLGVLAGAGAVVDYWPVGLKFPSITPTLEQAATAPMLAPIDVRAIAADTGSTAHVTARARAPQPVASPAPAALASFPTTRTFDRDLGDVVELQPLPAARFLTVSSEVPAFHIAPSALTAPLPQMLAERQASAMPSDGPDDGLIAGAFKRTGTSIVKTSMKTGVSIFDAVRVVGNVVRRALPN